MSEAQEPQVERFSFGLGENQAAAGLFKVHVYLTSGQEFTLDVTHFQTTRDHKTKELIGLEFTPPDKPQRHQKVSGYIKLSTVAAIVSEWP